MLHDTSDKGSSGGAMQMSREWIRFHLKQQLGPVEAKQANVNYDRFVYLVTSTTSRSGPAAPGVGDHIKALVEAVTQDEIDHTKHEHTHGISVEYGEEDIAKVETLRSRTNGQKRASQADSSSEESSRKPSSRKPTKRKQ